MTDPSPSHDHLRALWSRYEWTPQAVESDWRPVFPYEWIRGRERTVDEAAVAWDGFEGAMKVEER